jgi:signal transduction histidine kinase
VLQTDADVRAILAQPEALRRVAMLAARAVSNERMFTAVSQELARLVGADAAALLRFEPDETITLLAAWNAAGTRVAVGEQQPVNAALRRLRSSARPLRCGPADVPLTGPFIDEIRQFGIRATVAVPIQMDGWVWGVGVVASQSPEPFPAATEAWMVGFAELVATAISTAQSRAGSARSRADVIAAAEECRREIQGDVHDDCMPRSGTCQVPAGWGTGATSTDQVRCEVKRLAGVLLDDAERIAECSVARMQELLPSYAKVAAEKLIPVTLTNTRNLLEAVRDPHADPTRPEDHFRVSGETRVSQGIAADEMLQAWRIGLEVVREEAHPAACQLGIADDALLDFVEATLQWGDVGMRKSASAYRVTEIRELERLVAEKDALRRVATLVAQGAPPADVFAAVVDEVVELFPVDYAALGRYEPDNTITSLAHKGVAGPPPVWRQLLGGKNTATLVFETGRPARMDGLADASGLMENAAHERGVRSAVATPIFVDGRLWGAVGAGSTRELPPDIKARLADFTELVATAIANAESRAGLARLAEEQAALGRVATLVAEGTPPAAVFDAVAAEMATLLVADGITLVRYEPGDELTVLAHRGPAERQLPAGTRVRHDGASVSATVRRTRRPARMASYADTGGKIGEIIEGLRFRSGVGAPIVVDGRLWGATIANWTGEEPPPAGIEERLAKFARLLGTAIANADSRDQLSASRARLVTEAHEARRRVVRDLHDGGQRLLVHAIIKLKLAHRALDDGKPDLAPLLSEALEHAESANDELRELSHGQLPSVLTREGLRAGVDELAAAMSIPVDIDIGVGRLPAVVEATAYFVVAEALTNVIKHAHAERAEVRAFVKNETLHVEVRDSGLGGADPRGNGLVGLSDRVTALAGRLNIHSPAQVGTILAATLPLDSK